MFDIFMSFQLNIQQFKCFARFGLMHIVATNICVWIRTVFKVDFEKSMKAKITSRHFSGGDKGHRCLQSGQRRRCLWGLYDQRSFQFQIFKLCNIWQLFHKGKFLANSVSLLCLFVCPSLEDGETRSKTFPLCHQRSNIYFLCFTSKLFLCFIDL